MAIIRATIRPTSGTGGPFVVIVEKDNVVTEVDTGVTTLANALDTAKTATAAQLGGLTVRNVTVQTNAT